MNLVKSFILINLNTCISLVYSIGLRKRNNYYKYLLSKDKKEIELK